LTSQQMKEMQIEIDNMVSNQRQANTVAVSEIAGIEKKVRYHDSVEQSANQSRVGFGGDDLLSQDEKLGFGISEKRYESSQAVSMKGLTYTSG
jgi:hypothetical protein